jgi:NhaA family Na+:H+ antiporter
LSPLNLGLFTLGVKPAVNVAVLLGSLIAAALATVVLRARHHVYRRIRESEQVDRDHDDIPDIYRH